MATYSPLSLLPGALALTLLTSLPIQAADNPGVHSHGQAQLQVAVEPPRIDLMLVSPAANLVGFEHQPRTEAQNQAIESARDWLGSNPLVNSAGGCRLVEAKVSDGFDMAGQKPGTEHHQGGHKDHHKEHHKEHHKGHHKDHHKDHHEGDYRGHHEEHHGEHHGEHGGHHGDHHGKASGEHGGKHQGHGHGQSDEAQHREFTVAQQLTCEGDLKSLSTGLIQRFPGIEQLQVEWLGAEGQGSARLGAGDLEFSVTP